MIKMKAIFHYAIDDTECCGDYYSIDLYDNNNKLAAYWGDDYHDDGEDKLDGFIEGVEWAMGEKVKLEVQHIADA